MGHSPKREKEVSKQYTREMSFPEAMQSVIDGGKVTKSEWGSSNIYIYLVEEKLCIRKEDGVSYPVLISEGDMKGEDWVKV
jgi:hypothetical protein